MKILIYGLNYSPELTGIGKYSGEMTEWLAARGHEVRVVTAQPYYPEWRVADGYSAWRYRLEVASDATPSPQPAPTRGEGVEVYRCPLWVPARPSGAKRLLHLASFALTSFPVMLRQVFWKPDVVMVVEPALMCAPAAVLVARLCGAKSWLHIQDFEVDAAFALGLLKSNTAWRLATFLERHLLRWFDRVSTISTSMLNRLLAKGVPESRQVLFPNWADTASIFPLETSSTFREQLGVRADHSVVLYSGNMGAKQGLNLLLHSASLLQERTNIKFILCGDGGERAALEARYGHLENVTWLPLQPLEKLNELLNAADIHALPQRADAADLVMPSKLTGMMASGRPAVAAAAMGTEIFNVVSGRGIVVPPGDVKAFADAISILVADASLRRQLGAASRDYAVANFGKEAILSRFEQDLRACILEKPEK